jgi:uncharacterized protein (DUF488 family)
MPVNTLWTIGHSTRELDAFLALLTENKIESLADVRRFPGSRRHPHFNREALSATLQNAGITYTHFPTLGGRRTVAGVSDPGRTVPRVSDPARPKATNNTAWRVAAFAAYADYMLTEDFKSAFKELQTLATQKRTAIMCAEALPWRCHRRLIADQFIAQNWTVLDIVSRNTVKTHELPTFATITAGQVTYPGDSRPLFDTNN